MKARILLTINDDGLNAKWFGTVFCNPPYGRSLPRWIEKCAMEAERGVIVVALIPSRTDTRYWHHHIAGRADIWMLRGRLRFGDGQTPSPFPSAIILWNGDTELRNRLTGVLTDAWYVPPQKQTLAEYSRQNQFA